MTSGRGRVRRRSPRPSASATSDDAQLTPDALHNRRRASTVQNGQATASVFRPPSPPPASRTRFLVDRVAALLHPHVRLRPAPQQKRAPCPLRSISTRLADGREPARGGPASHVVVAREVAGVVVGDCRVRSARVSSRRSRHTSLARSSELVGAPRSSRRSRDTRFASVLKQWGAVGDDLRHPPPSESGGHVLLGQRLETRTRCPSLRAGSPVQLSARPQDREVDRPPPAAAFAVDFRRLNAHASSNDEAQPTQ